MAMAKVQRQGGSYHERMVGTVAMGHDHDYDFNSDLPDLIEEDVWSSIGNSGAHDVDDDNSVPIGAEDSHARSPTPKWSLNHGRPTGGLSLAFEDTGRSPPWILHQLRNVENRHHHRRHGGRHVASSAPVSVPDWPRILHVDSTDPHSPPAVEFTIEDEWLPPHEYLARASGRAIGTSVLEGVGRTLKGRDMSRVRNAVWRQTGFFG